MLLFYPQTIIHIRIKVALLNEVIILPLKESFDSSLIIHEREHMGLGKLRCPYENCPSAKKEFTDETSLSNHVKNHLDDRRKLAYHSL